MHIQSLKKTSVNTKFGQKEKYLITDEFGNQFDSWCSSWNASWKEGMDIDIKPEQIDSREYNGRTYKTIKCPPELKTRSFNYDTGNIAEDVKMINAKLNKVIDLLEAKGKTVEQVTDEFLEEPPMPTQPF